MKPGPLDIKVHMLIQGSELAELKRHTWEMAEAFGLDSGLERYQGKRPIGLNSWDMGNHEAIPNEAAAIYTFWAIRPVST
jgi:hypothetical protein